MEELVFVAEIMQKQLLLTKKYQKLDNIVALSLHLNYTNYTIILYNTNCIQSYFENSYINACKNIKNLQAIENKTFYCAGQTH